MATSSRFDWKKNWELQDVGDKEWLWDNMKDKSGLEWVQLVEFWDTPEHQSKEAGTPPSLGDLFMRTHTSSQTHNTLDDQSREYIVYEIYREVMPLERHGRVRLKGQGVTPTSYFGSRLSSDNHVNDLGSQLAEMQRVAQEKEEER
ncbi:hypothetical protein IFM89_020602 [Coptis chinensis]|uniref:Uncharacterized protein n=1 Tax=Coptis chinensis TaxID=261450 RepID=A0A835LWI7_9MAGN|nr:hypothetical protein IFM89_020602 [Coptis chinensis]